jgi:hypothetical protein
MRLFAQALSRRLVGLNTMGGKPKARRMLPSGRPQFRPSYTR